MGASAPALTMARLPEEETAKLASAPSALEESAASCSVRVGGGEKAAAAGSSTEEEVEVVFSNPNPNPKVVVFSVFSYTGPP